MFGQTLKDVENFYRDFAGSDMIYEEFEKLCREAWEDEDHLFFTDRSQKKSEWFVMYS